MAHVCCAGTSVCKSWCKRCLFLRARTSCTSVAAHTPLLRAQIFTGSVGDRPTLFMEIIQRIGCMKPELVATGEAEGSPPVATLVQEPGCGGFGKGNVAELYACMEQYDARLAHAAGNVAVEGGPGGEHDADASSGNSSTFGSS
jgi:hypothetical protein